MYIINICLAMIGFNDYSTKISNTHPNKAYKNIKTIRNHIYNIQ